MARHKRYRCFYFEAGRVLAVAVVIALAVGAGSGCTAFRSEAKYRLVRTAVKPYERLDNAVQPKADWAQVALCPVVLPAAYVAIAGEVVLFLTDDLVVNPPRFFFYGFRTGWRFLWGGEPGEGSAYRRAVWNAFKFVMTPPTILVACVGHALFLADDDLFDDE